MNIEKAMAATLAGCGMLELDSAAGAASEVSKFLNPPYNGQLVVTAETVDGKWEFRVGYGRGMCLNPEDVRPYEERPVIFTYSFYPERFATQDEAVKFASEHWDNNPVWTAERTKGFYDSIPEMEEEG